MDTRHKVSWAAANGRGHGSFDVTYDMPITDPDQIDKEQIRSQLSASAGFDLGPITILDIHPIGSA